MPRNHDLKRVLIIGAGPIVIGQACEFDYSGTQACKALMKEGLEGLFEGVFLVIRADDDGELHEVTSRIES